MNITIREADSKDYEVFDAMYGSLNDLHVAEHPGIFQHVSGHIFTKEEYAELLADPFAAVFIAEWDGEPAGFIQLRLREAGEIAVMKPRDFAVVESLYVHSQFRNHGLGEMLMLSGEEWAHEMEADSLMLNVYDFNTAARGLYEKMGYESLSRKMIKWM